MERQRQRERAERERALWYLVTHKLTRSTQAGTPLRPVEGCWELLIPSQVISLQSWEGWLCLPWISGNTVAGTRQISCNWKSDVMAFNHGGKQPWLGAVCEISLCPASLRQALGSSTTASHTALHTSSLSPWGLLFQNPRTENISVWFCLSSKTWGCLPFSDVRLLGPRDRMQWSSKSFGGDLPEFLRPLVLTDRFLSFHQDCPWAYENRSQLGFGDREVALCFRGLFPHR